LFKTKYIDAKEDHYYCKGCSGTFTQEYLDACDRCEYLDAVQFSPNYTQIKPRPGMGDDKLIRALFDKADLKFRDGFYEIRNLPNYAHLKCIQVASTAFLQQYKFIEAA
jgi:hypothetical protein